MRYPKLGWGLFLILSLLSTTSCFEFEGAYPSIAPGYWRATLSLIPPQMIAVEEEEDATRNISEVTEGELPFTFEVIYENDTTFYFEIINGSERIKVDDITLSHDRATNRDTILINFPIYGTYIKAAYQDHLIEGHWYVPYRGPNYAIPFKAIYGEQHRFTELRKTPATDLTGKWEATFDTDKTSVYPAIGEFKQDGNHLVGTFRTETGDYRFLEGTMQANKAYLSCFDGSHAFLFEAKLQADSSLIGSFRSGSHYRSLWEAKRNEDFELGDPDSLTYLNEGYEAFGFAFPNSKGETVDLNDAKYQGKIKIIQILGTWCPNCRDETNFLVDYLKQNPSEELAVIGLAFERYREEAPALAAIQRYQERMNVPYDILWGGYYNKKEAAEKLPMLNHVLSYPTMIFLDRNNKVRRIHTGFSGPATSKYAGFVNEFNTFVNSLKEESQNELSF